MSARDTPWEGSFQSQSQSKEDNMTRPFRILVLVCLAGFSLPSGTAQNWSYLDGHGPDAWQVVNVAEDDVLNLRMGPGTRYPVIGSFAPGETGLEQIVCVPFMTYEQGMNLSPAERSHLGLPPRWCLMTDADNQSQGWAMGRFLAEDTQPQEKETTRTSDPVIIAERLVKELYTVHELARRGDALSPFQRPRARDFFFLDDVERITGHLRGADPLYNAQDTEISDLSIAPHPQRAMFRGLITIRAEFLNFGQPHTVDLQLRADPAQAGAPIRIMRIQHSSDASSNPRNQ